MHFAGQFVVFTYPHIGNVGINPGALLGFCCFVSQLQCVVMAAPDSKPGSKGAWHVCSACLARTSIRRHAVTAALLAGRSSAAGDMESEQVHMGAVIVRDLSISVSNYRANMTLDEYLKQQKVGGSAWGWFGWAGLLGSTPG